MAHAVAPVERPFRAKFRGRCDRCEGRIVEGELIARVDEGSYQHERMADCRHAWRVAQIRRMDEAVQRGHLRPEMAALAIARDDAARIFPDDGP